MSFHAMCACFSENHSHNPKEKEKEKVKVNLSFHTKRNISSLLNKESMSLEGRMPKGESSTLSSTSTHHTLIGDTQLLRGIPQFIDIVTAWFLLSLWH